MMKGIGLHGSDSEATFGLMQQKHVGVTNFSPPSNEPCLLSGNSVYGTVKVIGSVVRGHSSSHKSALWGI